LCSNCTVKSLDQLDVPPTLVSFAVATGNAEDIISPQFKQHDSPVFLLEQNRDQMELPDFDSTRANFGRLHQLIKEKKILSAQSVREGGIAIALSRMALGNRIGFQFNDKVSEERLFTADYGSIIVELKVGEDIDACFSGTRFLELGKTISKPEIYFGDNSISLAEIKNHMEAPLSKIFPTQTTELETEVSIPLYTRRSKITGHMSVAKPRVIIPVFPGTNCEFDTAAKFEQAGAEVDTFVFRNLSPKDVQESTKLLAKKINNSQILMIPGGFSAGDEPEGSGKFIASVMRNPYISESVMNLLNKNVGLVLGICNGFQALIKLGLVPYGEIREISTECPTLTFNTIGRHVSRMVTTKVVSILSPWLSRVQPGDLHVIPVSHGEGRFIAGKEQLQKLINNGQVATQYVNNEGTPSMIADINPNGSFYAIEGITSPDGRVMGKMAHSERMGQYVGINIPGNKDQQLFESGVNYFS